MLCVGVTMICYRCGSCCKGLLALIPRTSKSNLSPDLLEELGMKYGSDYVDSYINDNSEFMEDRCKWLQENPDGTAKCLVHDYRSSHCRDYPGSSCNVGRSKMSKPFFVLLVYSNEGRYTYNILLRSNTFEEAKERLLRAYPELINSEENREKFLYTDKYDKVFYIKQLSDELLIKNNIITVKMDSFGKN